MLTRLILTLAIICDDHKKSSTLGGEFYIVLKLLVLLLEQIILDLYY